METHTPDEVVGAVEASDRRRPGRSENASLGLIALLRGTGKAPAELAAPEDDENASQLSTARGVKVAVSLATLFWGLVITSFALALGWKLY